MYLTNTGTGGGIHLSQQVYELSTTEEGHKGLCEQSCLLQKSWQTKKLEGERHSRSKLMMKMNIAQGHCG